jgi:hypothetical protein
MSLQLHDFFTRHTDHDAPIMIVEGDAIVAHVHDPEYLQMFLHAPQMRSLIEKLSAMECDPASAEHDSETCGVCQARILLATMQSEADAVSTNPLEVDMLG